jgi:hypothetical protein
MRGGVTSADVQPGPERVIFATINGVEVRKMTRASGRLLAILGLAIVVVTPASAENRLGIWPGMSVDEVAAALKPRCPNIIISGDDEKYVTCQVGEAADATVIKATVSSKGRTYYIAWREASSDEALTYAKKIASELGLSGAGKDCRFYDYELRCWQAKDGTVLYAGERDAQKRFVNYIVSDKVREEDEGPAAEAPVKPAE